MDKINFSWDKNKAQTNFKKHKISFEEAQTVFEMMNKMLESLVLENQPNTKKTNTGSLHYERRVRF